jgi:hypothetical protein
MCFQGQAVENVMHREEQRQDREDTEQTWLAKQRRDEAASSWSSADRERAQTSAPASFPDVEEGRYAVEIEGVLKFYQVDKPMHGKWAGWTFLKVQASDELWPIKNRDAKLMILNKIAEDSKTAMLRYGQEIGKCGACGRTLTDEESRAYGIGPVCRGKLGW